MSCIVGQREWFISKKKRKFSRSLEVISCQEGSLTVAAGRMRSCVLGKMTPICTVFPHVHAPSQPSNMPQD
uniref:Uncharacterized protein n=1 Tax=Oryza brachyantha TaxID=4533 RepID=J3MBX0_ORYBR